MSFAPARPGVAAALLAFGTAYAQLLPPAAPAAGPAPAPGAASAPAGPEAVRAVEETLEALAARGVTVPPSGWDDAVRRAAVSAADPGGAVFDAEAWTAFRAGCAGLEQATGLRLAVSNGQAVVTGLAPGAEDLDIAPGDLLESVNGRYVSGRRTDELYEWLKAATNGTVQVDVMRPGSTGDATRVAAPLRQVRAPAVRTAEEWPRALCYLALNGIYEGTGQDVADRVRGWERAKRFGVVLDLRGAAGASAADAAVVAGLVHDAGTEVARWQPLDGDEARVLLAGGGGRIRMPVMVIVDGRTRGAAEALAAMLKRDAGGAMLLGRPTAGDPLVREGLAAPGGGVLYVRTSRLLAPDGTEQAGGEGIAPHLLVRANGGSSEEPFEPDPRRDSRRKTLEQEKADRLLRDRVGGDAALQRAVDILVGLRALRPDDETAKAH